MAPWTPATASSTGSASCPTTSCSTYWAGWPPPATTAPSPGLPPCRGGGGPCRGRRSGPSLSTSATSSPAPTASGPPCAAGAGAASASSTAPRRGSLAPAPPGGGGGWVIETLSLKLILTRRDYLRRIGELVGGAGGAGTVRRVELDVATETECLPLDDTRAMLGYGERFVHFAGDCPGAFRSLAKLTLRSLWFHGDGAAALGELVRGCDALEFLCLKDCGLLPDGATEIAGDGPPPCALAIDAPRSRLRALLCDFCYVGRLELVHAPALAFVQYRAVFLEDSRPILFRRTPSLRAVYLCYGQLEEDDDVKLELSDLLVNVHQLEWLTLSFDICKIWLQLEHPKRLRPVLGRLRQLNLKNTHPDCDLSWAIFLLEAAPLLLTLDFHIFNHPCSSYWRKKGDWNTNLTWQPSPEFRHHHLKKLSFRRTFHLERDLPFARLIMELAVNLQSVTFGTKSLSCQRCIAAQRNYPGLAESSLRFTQGNEHVDAFVKELKDGISTSAQITIQFSDLD